MSKTVEEFFRTVKQTNIKPSFYYTNYQVVAKHLHEFEDLLNALGTVENEGEFINLMKIQYAKDKSVIRIIPLFTGVRPDKLVVLEKGKTVNKFNADNVSFDEAIDFLREVGFLERISELSPFNLKSYFFGVNVGLDSNGRKNRSGKQMEMIVGTHLKGAGKDFIEQANIAKVNKKWNTNFTDSNKKKKKFDFVVKGIKAFYFIETNFFNSNGSKTDINASFIRFEPYLKNISKEIKFIVITDGKGLQKTEIADLIAKLDNVWNIDDLENGILTKEMV